MESTTQTDTFAPPAAAAARQPALLLLGPTGSGKTPLGDLLQERGLWECRCLHFDFGANLRRIVARNSPSDRITAADIEFLRQVLQSGALLEDEHFPLAQRTLSSFLAECGADPYTLVILNGLPRHVGQAEAMDAIVDMKAVVCLECSPSVARGRIHSNVGGDRTGREDDDPRAVEEKIAMFERRTAPLLDYYRARNVPACSIEVTPTVTPEDMWQHLSASR